MRARSQKKSLSVQAVAGTEVVLLGLNVSAQAARGLLGFTVKRSQGKTHKWLAGGKTFSAKAAGEGADSRTFPIQAFLWGDYEVAANTEYTYAVTARYGKPDALRDGDTVTVKLCTEDPDDGRLGIFFNRGVAGSQAYSRQFGQYRRFYLVEQLGRQEWKDFIRPEQVPGSKAWKWLSRGLEEAMFAFIRQAVGPRFGLRAAVYEFSYLPAVAEFAAALETGADVRIIHHAKRTRHQELRRGAAQTVETPDDVARAADAAIRQVGIKQWKNTARWKDAFTERIDTTISHNKFIVLLVDGRPKAVWTGSTNFTAGGIFGQSNVGHVIRDEAVAARYLAYWEKLKTDPPRKRAAGTPEEMGLQDWNVHSQPDLQGPPPPDSLTTIFSPRPTTGMLQWYADRLAAATSSVHFTAAFGVSQQIAQKLLDPAASAPDSFLRYIMLEDVPGAGASRKRKDAARKSKKPVPLDYYDFTKQARNRIAWGGVLRQRQGAGLQERVLAESLSGLNTNVDFLHTKYLLIDPLTADPTVVTGSANFSDNSTTMNDENMLVIRGDTRVADIFLTEFMRLFNHFQHRNKINALPDEQADATAFLCAIDAWTAPYFAEGSPECAERLLFSKAENPRG
ncbi:MAG: phospholipase D-like domain-containing protein [Gemmataceae bacterium]